MESGIQRPVRIGSFFRVCIMGHNVQGSAKGVQYRALCHGLLYGVQKLSQGNYLSVNGVGTGFRVLTRKGFIIQRYIEFSGMVARVQYSGPVSF